jgi:L-lactate dehydrogenase complex protein LldG
LHAPNIESQSKCVDAFVARFAVLSGTTHVVDNVKAAAETIAGIVASENVDCIAIAGLDADVADALNARGFGSTRILKPPFPTGELPGLLDTPQIGITGAAYGIAETGTLIEIATDDSIRLVSGLPRTHIGVVRASNIVPKFFDSAELLREAFATHGSNCVVSFISGPSRTGDIEMILTLGVHGPERAHAVIIQE